MRFPEALSRSVFASFELLHDPRAPNRRFPLETILFIAVVGTLCGANGFVQIEEIARMKRHLIGKYVHLPDGDIPTHDTISRLFQVLSPREFTQAFIAFIEDLTGKTTEEVVALDGKTLRGAVSKKDDAEALKEDVVHMVSAFSTKKQVVLGQIRSAAKRNENEAARQLLAILDVSEAIVTMDAAHCSADTISVVKQRKGDVVVAVKGNQPRLLADVDAEFKARAGGAHAHIDEAESHGRRERRQYEILDLRRPLDERWADVKSIIRVQRERTDLTTFEREESECHFISTLPAIEHERLARAIRAHWSIENQLHWRLDVQFDEDGSRVRTGNAAENLARVRHMALALLSQLPNKRRAGIALRRLLAGMDDGILEKIFAKSDT